MNVRAQPDVGVDLSLPPVGQAETKPSNASFLLRMHPNLKDRFMEAAKREGLSLNAWGLRVLAEHAKLSEAGWRSVPTGDPPRTAPAAPTASAKYRAGTDIWPATLPGPTTASSGTITLAGATANSGDVTWVAPDEDIPEL
jgi:hypothetical protein